MKEKNSQINRLEFLSGEGISDENKTGLFEVRASVYRKFEKISEAIEYYNTLQEDKALWDLTKSAELLQSHRIVH